MTITRYVIVLLSHPRDKYKLRFWSGLGPFGEKGGCWSPVFDHAYLFTSRNKCDVARRTLKLWKNLKTRKVTVEVEE